MARTLSEDHARSGWHSTTRRQVRIPGGPLTGHPARHITWSVFYLHDGLLVGPLDRVQEAFAGLCRNLAIMGLSVNLRKCALWGPGAHATAELPDNHPLRHVPVTSYTPDSGLKVLGVPIGRPGEHGFQASTWDRCVARLEDACTQLTGVPDPQVQHTLLRQCLDAAKVQFLLRTTDSSAPPVQDHIARADTAIFNVFEGMIGQGLGPLQRRQVILPFSHGGCGVRLPSDVAAPARIAGLACHLRDGKTRVGVPLLAAGSRAADLGPVILNLQATFGTDYDPLKDWAADLSRVGCCQVEHTSQKWWTRQWGETKLRSLRKDATGRDSARLAAQSEGLGSAWMQVVHLDEGTGRIDPAEYRLGLKWLLGVPIIPADCVGTPCPACATPMDHHGDHLLCCRKNNFYGRHFAVQEALITIAQAGGQPFVREAPLTDASTNLRGPALRPADILLRAWQGGKDTAVDVTIRHPLQSAELPWSGQKAASFLKATEKAKESKYKAVCQSEGWSFSPAAFDTWGGLGPQAKDLLHKLIARATGTLPPELKPLRVVELRQLVSLALMRQVWRLLLLKNRLFSSQSCGEDTALD